MRIYNYYTELEAKLKELEWTLGKRGFEIHQRIRELKKEKEEFLHAVKGGRISET